ncbi:MAG: YeeE/YedE thiosulfate transporter family protein [Myxococcota bacterium]
MSLVDSWPMVFGGLLTGLVFGFLLNKGQVSSYAVIVGQFLWVDHTVLKIMLTAIVVGSIGVYGMLAVGWIDGLLIKPALLVANLVGGLVFGVGMVGVGYCPGTGVAAIGAGSKHAIAALLGMIAGAALFTEAYPWIDRALQGTPDLGKVSLTDVTGISPWVFVVALALIAVAAFAAIERSERRRGAA